MRSASQQQGGGSIMSGNKKDDEEDELEALRLAALESLRAKGLPPPIVPVQRLSPKPSNACNNAVRDIHEFKGCIKNAKGHLVYSGFSTSFR